MAARKKKKSSKRSGGGSFAAALARWLILLAIGVAGGYAWRSYAPLPVPVESPLTADSRRSSANTTELREVAVSAERRAQEAEREVDRLRRTLSKIEESQKETEQELADMQIKSMLRSD